MGFLGVYRAVYDYAPQGEGELAITEGDILYVLEKSGEDDWWKVKRKASGDDDEEPIGLIPNNYIEEAHPSHHARALYDYTRQTDEELSFSEDAQLEVFDISDPDWILVGLDGEYGFAPANYIDVLDDASVNTAHPAAIAASRRKLSEESNEARSEPPQSPVQSPATALAGIIHQRQTSSPSSSRPQLALPPRPQFTPQASDEEEQSTPSLPTRPKSQSISTHSNDYPTPRSPDSTGIAASPPRNRVAHRGMDEEVSDYNSGGFHIYNINEMVSVMGKRKKMPTTLGVNLATGTIMIAPEKARDGPQQEWTAEKMTHYSIEGKHVFLELVRPSKSVDFHAGAKDTAEEIVAALGEMSGAVKAEGLREVILAGSGQGLKKGVVLYDFMAQGDDEVSVEVDDEVIIIDDTKSEEWWQVRRLQNGKEGVVPSSYVELTGTISNPGSSGINAGKSTVEQNRLEEQRLAREAVKDHRSSEVGPGMRLPERGSSLSARESTTSQQRSSRDDRPLNGQPRPSKAKPDPTKVRMWTDRSKTFSVEAQFLALKDGKINLHKMNGVKIAVPVVKMSVEDLEYVERITGVSLDEDKPLSDIKRQRSRATTSHAEASVSIPAVGATIEQPKKPEYDWFQFFLSCDVAVGLCERYAQTFQKDSMDESVLPDVDITVLRTLGLREGDIIKVMRYLDNKYSRANKRNVSFGNGEEAEGGSGSSLFSGPGGALKNNTRKGRPAPTVQTNDVIDPKAFSQSGATEAPSRSTIEEVPPPAAPAATQAKKTTKTGFDDDAWDVKPSQQQAQIAPLQASQQSTSRTQAQLPTLIGSLQELSLLSAPLEPTKVQPVIAPPQIQPAQQQQLQQAQQQAPQLTGATPSFFASINQQQPANFQQQPSGFQPQPTGFQQQPANSSFLSNPQIGPQQPGYGQQQPSQQNIARQRPAAPQFIQNQNSLMPPPPPRPLSAPQTAQQSAFGPPPLQPQMTGVPNSSGFQLAPLAPPGQSLAEINQMRMQQQHAQQQQQQIQPQMTGYTGQAGNMMPQQTGFGQFNVVSQQRNGFGQQMQPQQTGFQQQQSFMNSQGPGGPFADPRLQQFSPSSPPSTGFQSSFSPPQQYSQQTGINSFLPPALQPQKNSTIQPQQTGINGFGPSFAQPPQMPPMPQLPAIAPLQPQKTGPPPPVRFGVTGDTKKLMPQATGRRANLAAATPQNPFGF